MTSTSTNDNGSVQLYSQLCISLILAYIHRCSGVATWQLLYMPLTTLSFILKHKVNALFNSHAVKFTKNIASGSLAGAISLSLIYSLDYARNHLASDVKDGLKGNTRQFNCLSDVYAKTFKSDGLIALYRGLFIS